MRQISRCSLLVFFFLAECSGAFAQKPTASYADKYPLAKFSEKQLYEFDLARPLKQFDATPTGSNWFAVDEFALMNTIVIRGTRFERRFNEIPSYSTSLSPKGDYVIYMGLDRSFDSKGFNTTTTTVFKANLSSSLPDSVGAFTSDYNNLFFSRTGDHWAATLPASNQMLHGLRDVVLVDGLIAAKDNPKPGKFAFDHSEENWAYRSTDNRDENLVTKFKVQKMYTRAKANPYLASADPTVYHFTPDLRLAPFQLDGRDYDFDFQHAAQLYKTSYFPDHQDTAHMYLIFAGKREPNFRWINNIQIDTGGTHIAYFACDTTGEGSKIRNEKVGVVVEDGKIISGPYDEMGRLFLSPSGKNLAWTASKKGQLSLYLNGKKIGDVGESMDVAWTSDEKKIAYLTSDDRGKQFVVVGGKRSPNFDRVARLGWSDDGKELLYCAVKYNKLLQIRQQY